MSKKIRMTLSESSINDAIRQIEEYRNLIEFRIKIFLAALAREGVVVAGAIVSEVPDKEKGDSLIADFTTPEKDGDTYKASVYVTGDKVLFIEFSAGITFGTNNFQPLPNNSSYGSGYGMGTYNPESDNWKNPDGWWYQDEHSGQYEHTYGNKAYAPMYNADKAMRDVIVENAKYAFGG